MFITKRLSSSVSIVLFSEVTIVRDCPLTIIEVVPFSEVTIVRLSSSQR